MSTSAYDKNHIIHHVGDLCDTLEFISTGKVEVHGEGFSIVLKSGCVIGLLEHPGSNYNYEYIALEETSIINFPYVKPANISTVIEDQFANCEHIVTAAAAMTMSSVSKFRYQKKQTDRFIATISTAYENYKNVCNIFKLEIQSFPFLEKLEEYVPDIEIPEWVDDYYDQLEIMPNEIKEMYFSSHPSLSTATVLEAASHASMFLKMCTEINHYNSDLLEQYFSDKNADIIDLYSNMLTSINNSNENNTLHSVLLEEAIENIEIYISELGKNPLVPNTMFMPSYKQFEQIFISSDNNDKNNMVVSDDDSSKYQNIRNSLDIIIKYSNLDDAETERLKLLFKKFRTMKNKNSSEESDRLLRQEISKSFFDIYETVMINSLEMKNIPTILKMFFYFGYMDENLVGLDNALLLYEMAEKLDADGRNGVYTLYDWLRSIYNGENEPSRNEFDQDYITFIKSQRQSGFMTEEMESRYINSPNEKLIFEVNNLFKISMKMCGLHPSSYCPVLSQHNILKPLNKMMLTINKVRENWDNIRNIDYSVFYRECSYHNESINLPHDRIMIEVIPDVILMPTIGQQGGLWQEISGNDRCTPARMFLPIFLNEDSFSVQTKLAGNFRWSICKRIQGARWNDITEHSLTSEYFDYLQFYRKNKDLSPDTKDKIKSQLSNNNNNFKNVFIADYISWIKYESQGTPRLNKVARNILYEFCTPSKKIRQELQNNPMYKDMINRSEIKAAKTYKNLDSKYSKLVKTKDNLPEEIQNYMLFYTL